MSLISKMYTMFIKVRGKFCTKDKIECIDKGMYKLKTYYDKGLINESDYKEMVEELQASLST